PLLLLYLCGLWMFLLAPLTIAALGLPLTAPLEIVTPVPRLPSAGRLVCPYCEHDVAERVSYLGQQVQCPECSSLFHAPHQHGNAELQMAIVSFWGWFLFTLACAALILWPGWLMHRLF